MDNIINKKIVKKKTKKIPLDLIILEELSPKNKTIKLTSSSKSITKRSRCKKGTKKYKSLGDGCYTIDEIEAFKSLNKLYKSSKKKTKSNTKSNKKAIELEIVEGPVEIIDNKTEKRIETELKPMKKLTKRNLKIPIELEIMEEKKRYNEDFIELMEKLSNIMYKQGEPFRARAYQKAQESIMGFTEDIISPSQLKGLPGIGSTIMEKLNEYVNTGTLKILEREKTNPINILAEIYGVGPKKAQELVNAGISSIDDLKIRQDELLNNVQKIGLLYHDQIQQRIPRQEIEEFEKIFKKLFVKSTKDIPDSKFEIVGSYRRGAQNSGDIDVIITGKSDIGYKNFIDDLLSSGIILEILSRGPSKTLVIAKLPGDHIARRVDFLYSPLNEFPFAILYFTGSKIFNTVMRQHGLNKGYTFNEHGIYKFENKKKGELIKHNFKNEKDIFEFLNLEYKTPIERKDGRAVIIKPINQEIPQLNNIKNNLQQEETLEIIPVKKNKTLKKRKQKPELIINEEEINEEKINDEKTYPNDTQIIQIIDNFKHKGITVLESLNEKQLTDMLRLASNKYYNQNPIISDNQFDIIKEFIEQKFPNNVALNEIGAEVERNKVKLPYEMASMDKIKPDTNALNNWISKYAGPYIISCKLDGVSGLYTTKGSTPKLYTRGNGKVGQDVSHLIPFLRLPKTKGIVIRGEFIIPKATFEKKYKSTFANPRNMVAGIVNHKHISESVVDLHFVAYEVIIPELKPSEQMTYLGTINVERVDYKMENNITNELLSNLLIEWRKSNIYEIDGIIVTDDKLYPRKSGNPEHSFAFKMILSDQVAEAKVIDVLWTPSKDGYLKPRVQIEPINLGGVTIEYATGFNGAFIKDNNIGIGTTIELIRSGDVIPHIKSVTVPSDEPKMPSVPYKWNETHVDIMLENASEDPTVKEKNITGFFKGIGVDGLSTGNITKLILAGYDTVPKIIGMSEKDFLTIEGFKGKMANKLYTGIQQKLKESSIIKLMAASNIFGRGFSEKRLELILNDLPDILISDESKEAKIQSVKSLKGMAQKTAEAFVEKIENFKTFINECGLEDKIYEKPKDIYVDQANPLYDKTIVLTGTRDKQIIDYLKNIGAILGTNVSKSTFLVVAKNKDDDTGKAEEARKLNIPIISVEEFIKTYIS